MPDEPTVNKFVKAVRRQLDQFRREFSLTYAEAIGALDMVKYDLHREAWSEANAEDDDAE